MYNGEQSFEQEVVVATDYPFKNLVFEGGGVKGIAYIGAIEALDQAGALNQIERVAGTSAGAITAMLMSLPWPCSTP